MKDAESQASADKWEVQLRKGCLELAVLAALWDEKLYGLDLRHLGLKHSGLILGAAFILSKRNQWVWILAHGFIDTVGVVAAFLGWEF